MGDGRRDYLREAHVFCLPSYYPFEGQPVSILEAYASGCVVVTTDQGGIRDVFREGENGLWVAKASVDDLVVKLRHLMVMPPRELKRMAEHNLALACSVFSEGRFDQDVLALFESLEGRKAATP